MSVTKFKSSSGGGGRRYALHVPADRCKTPVIVILLRRVQVTGESIYANRGVWQYDYFRVQSFLRRLICR